MKCEECKFFIYKTKPASEPFIKAVVEDLGLECSHHGVKMGLNDSKCFAEPTPVERNYFDPACRKFIKSKLNPSQTVKYCMEEADNRIGKHDTYLQDIHLQSKKQFRKRGSK